MRQEAVLLLCAAVTVGCVDDAATLGTESFPCGVESGTAFHIEVYESLVFPYKPDSEAPWDWDGDVPNWMIDVTNALSYILVSPELKTAAEIMELVDQYGPLLLEDTVPPDPILYAFAALDDATMTTTSTTFGGTTYTYTYGTYMLDTVNARDDTYRPNFNRAVDFELFPGESFYLLVEDEDLAFDDTVGGFAIGLGELRELSGCGVQSLRGSSGNGLYSMDVAVEAL